MDIWEKLARCETPGELKRMCNGTNWELVEKDEIDRLRANLKDQVRRKRVAQAKRSEAIRAIGFAHSEGFEWPADPMAAIETAGSPKQAPDG